MFEGFQIIYIEDDTAVRNSLTQTLELAGFAVQPCATAEAALRFLTPELRGIVICDVQLPKMSGLDLLRHAVQINREIPVILVTGHGDVDMAVQAMRDGAYDFLEKPFAPERLVDVATRSMEKRVLRMPAGDVDTATGELPMREHTVLPTHYKCPHSGASMPRSCSRTSSRCRMPWGSACTSARAKGRASNVPCARNGQYAT